MIEGVNKNIDTATIGNITEAGKLASDIEKNGNSKTTSDEKSFNNNGNNGATAEDKVLPAEAQRVKNSIDELAGRPRERLKELPGNTLEEIKISFDDHIIDARNRTLQFSKDEDTGKTIIRVIDTETEEVIRQIPPEEFLKMVKRLNDVAQEIFKRIPKFI